MSLFQRAHDIVTAKANEALDTADNPSEMLDCLYDQMLRRITKARQWGDGRQPHCALTTDDEMSVLIEY
jgi:flagellin-specific chaperone FliS